MRVTMFLALAGTAIALGAGPSASGETAPGSSGYYAKMRGKAREVAHRTFIYERNYGGPHAHGRHNRRFSLRGQDSYTVQSPDGSLLTAFQATLSSVDGTGDAVLLFRDLNFIGWATNRLAGNLLLGRRGNRILVRYYVYKGRNAFCCPSGKKAITYRWNGSRVVSSGKPPLIFGKPGQKLHWVGGRATASAYWRKCGSQPHGGFGWYHVKAHNTFCGKARAVARRYTYGLIYNPSPEPLGFSCRDRQTGYEVSRAACRRISGHRIQKVRFIFGA